MGVLAHGTLLYFFFMSVSLYIQISIVYLRNSDLKYINLVKFVNMLIGLLVFLYRRRQLYLWLNM